MLTPSNLENNELTQFIKLNCGVGKFLIPKTFFSKAYHEGVRR